MIKRNKLVFPKKQNQSNSSMLRKFCKQRFLTFILRWYSVVASLRNAFHDSFSGFVALFLVEVQCVGCRNVVVWERVGTAFLPYFSYVNGVSTLF